MAWLAIAYAPDWLWGKDGVEEGGIALNDTPLGMLYLQPPTHTKGVQRWELKKRITLPAHGKQKILRAFVHKTEPYSRLSIQKVL